LNPKSKIALVANTTWNIYNFRLNVIRKLRDEGHEVIVMAPVDKYISYQWKIPGVSHYPIHTLRRDSINPIKDLRLTRELVQLYKKHKPDLIVHYTVKPNIYGGFAARIAGIPSIAVVTGLGYAFIHNGFIKQTTKALYKLSSRFHRKVVFENQDDRALFVDEHLLVAEKGMTVNGCGVDLQYFAPLNPWLHIYYASTGVNALGQLINDGQQISRQDALRLYTRENGWFLRMEDRLGAIEPGKLADLAVLSNDYLTVTDEQLKRIQSVLTIVDGKIVYDAGVLK
jgi:hypothetical protein